MSNRSSAFVKERAIIMDAIEEERERAERTEAENAVFRKLLTANGIEIPAEYMRTSETTQTITTAPTA